MIKAANQNREALAIMSLSRAQDIFYAREDKVYCFIGFFVQWRLRDEVSLNEST